MKLLEKGEVIRGFNGKYSFLSNFSMGNVVYEGTEFRFRENAFQAAKTINENMRDLFRWISPGEAKMRGRGINLREDWESVRDGVMYEVVLDCFSRNKWLGEKLIYTGDAYLVEDNNWGDMYWGQCMGVGLNKLGEILMRVRKEIGGS